MMSEAMIKYLVRSAGGAIMLGGVVYQMVVGGEIPESAWYFIVGIYGIQQVTDGLTTVRVIKRNEGNL